MNELELFNGVKVPRSLSYSKINTFLDCKLKYYYDYVEGKETPSSDPLDIGKAIHKCLEEYTLHCLKNDIKQDVEYMQNLAYNIDYLSADAWKDMNDVVMEYAEENEVESDAESYEVEKPVALDTNLDECDWKDDDAVFRGKLDFVEKKGDKTVVITDWKSNRYLPPDSKVQEDLQLLTYAWLASKVWPDMEHFKIRLHFVRYHAFRPRENNVYESRRTDQIEDRLMNIFEKIYEAEKNGEFPATINSNCKFCPFRKICDRFQEVNDELGGVIEVPEGEEERVELAEKYQGAKNFKKDLQDTLKEEVERRGPITIGGDENSETLDFHKTNSTEFDPPKEVISYLRDETDIPVDDLWRCVKISKSDLKKVLREHDEYSKLSEVSEQTSGTRFSFQ